MWVVNRVLSSLGALAGATGLVSLLLMVLSSAVPVGAADAAGYAWIDDFEVPALDQHWSWVREDPSHWSTTERPGFLRITTQQGGLIGTGGNARNLLVRRAPVGRFQIETRVLLTPTENFHIAGLLVYQDDDNFLMLGRAYCDLTPPYLGNAIYFDHEEQSVLFDANYAMTTTVPGEAYLRIERDRTVFTGYVSENGVDWTPVGVHTAVSGLVPSMVGLAAEPSWMAVAEIPADFDYFQLDDRSYAVLLPLVLRRH
jgi:beta-xylosidase